MRTIAKLAHLGNADGHAPLHHLLGRVRRAIEEASDRRSVRPLQDLDSWSDQAEVAYYEGLPAGRSL